MTDSGGSGDVLQFPRMYRMPTTDCSGQEKESYFNQLLHDVRQRSDVDAILEHLDEKLLMTAEQIHQSRQMVRQLERFLNQNGFQCQLRLFGSIECHLAFCGDSDVDIFVETNDPFTGQSLDRRECNRQQISNAFRTIKKVIRTGAETFFPFGYRCHIVCQPNIRVPLFRLFIETDVGRLEDGHIVMQTIDCDLNVNNSLGLANTRLLRFLCRFERRFHAVTILVRFWFRELLPDIKRKISSYAITLLVLFYFQIKKILPSIEYLVRLSPAANARYVHEYRCDFCEDRNRIRFATDNRQTVLELYVDFLHYYSDFQYQRYRMSTNHGRTYYRQSDRAAIELMDPFDWKHNVAIRLRRHQLEQLTQHFRLAYNSYSQLLHH